MLVQVGYALPQNIGLVSHPLKLFAVDQIILQFDLINVFESSVAADAVQKLGRHLLRLCAVVHLRAISFPIGSSLSTSCHPILKRLMIQCPLENIFKSTLELYRRLQIEITNFIIDTDVRNTIFDLLLKEYKNLLRLLLQEMTTLV